MYGAFGRDFATRDGRRVMVVAISLNQWHTLVAATGIEEHLAPMERAFDADFRKEEDRYRARDGIAALLKPWFETRTLDEVRKALDEHGVCWGPVPDVHAAARRRLARVADEPGVRRRRPPGHRHAAALRRRRCGSRPIRRSRPRRHRCSAPTPTTCSTPCSVSPPSRSDACTTTAWSPAKCRSVRERRADPRRHRLRRTSPQLDVARAGGPPGGVPRRRSVDARPGTLPRLWHWACFPPLVPTAGLGHDGHPRRRPEMEAFPQRMWVGGRVQIERPLRLGVDAARSSRIVRADAEGRRRAGASGWSPSAT